MGFPASLIIAACLIAFLLSRPGTLGFDSTDIENFPDPNSDAMNQDYLSSLPYDVLRQVCASASSDPNLRVPLDGLSRSTKHLRDISLPDVFRNVLIRGGWDFASSRLKAMEECHAILSFVKVFKFDIYEGNGAIPPPQSMPSELAILLSTMSRLEKLVFVVPEYHTSLFEEAFRHSELIMPSVDILVVGPYCEFMVAICPNVTIVSNNGYQWLPSDRARDNNRVKDHSMKLIRAAGASSKLRHFEMMESWEVGLLEELVEFMPNIASMGMDGGYYHDALEELLPTLSRFQHLQTLALAGAHALNVGFNPPRCGNIYMGPGGAAVRQQVNREGEEAERKVAHMIFPVCASLEELWIGDTRKAVAERSPDGRVKNITMSECDRDKVVKYPRA